MSEQPKPQATKTMKVTVSMDGLRHNLARSYIELVEMLNYTFKHGFEIDKNELEEKLCEIAQGIGVLHCVYDPEREQFTDMSDQTGRLHHIITFNSPSDE